MIVIVDYKMGNLGSISNIIKKVGFTSIISSDKNVIEKADKIILPGVGAFDKAMKNLSDLDLIEILNQKALVDKTPILGICLGMQLMTNSSEEGNVKGLGWIDAKTIKFQLQNFPELKIPHMGWNPVHINKTIALCNELYLDSRFYFVHSYHVVCSREENILMTTDYGEKFTSGIICENIAGVQFHPEKSHKFGIQLMKNFLEKW